MNKDIAAAYDLSNNSNSQPVQPLISGEEEIRDRFRPQIAVDESDDDESYEERLDSSDSEEEEKVHEDVADNRRKLTVALEQMYQDVETMFREENEERESGDESDDESDDGESKTEERTLERQADDVVMHYKAMMSSKKYLPDHPEGVKVFISVPTEEPQIDKFKEWSAKEATVTSIQKFLRVEALHFTDEDKEDWQKWLIDIEQPEEYFRNELSWNLQEIAEQKDRLFRERQEKAFSDLRTWDDVLSAEQKNNDAVEEFVASAQNGFSETEKARLKRRRVEERRIAIEDEEAKNWEEIKRGDFLVVLEDPSTMTEEQRRSTYRNFHPKELISPLFVADAVEDCSSHDRNVTLQVRRWRCTEGDFNKSFFKAVRFNDSRDWIEEIPRSSVVQVGIKWVTNGKKMSFETKKQLVENSSTPCVFEKNNKGKQLLKFTLQITIYFKITIWDFFMD